MEAAFLFAEYLFDSFPIRKLYCDVYEYNEKVVKLLYKLGCVDEGRFEQHIWYGDKYWALLRLSLFRDAWVSERQRLRELIGVQNDIDWAAEQRTPPASFTVEEKLPVL